MLLCGRQQRHQKLKKNQLLLTEYDILSVSVWIDPSVGARQFNTDVLV